MNRVPGVFWTAVLFLLLAGCQAGESTSASSDDETTLQQSPPQPAAASEKAEAAAPAVPIEFAPGNRYVLFSGTDLTRWRIPDEFCFERHGKVYPAEGTLVLETGDSMTGIAWNGGFPANNYEVRLEAMRVAGDDFFCGMTFPVGDSWCTLIVGGWGGMVVGLSNVDGMNAAENQTTRGMRFETGRWYAIRLRVTDEAIEVWIDGEQEIRQKRDGHRFDIWWEQEPAKPFGINTWYTHGALRNMVLEMLP